MIFKEETVVGRERVTTDEEWARLPNVYGDKTYHTEL